MECWDAFSDRVVLRIESDDTGTSYSQPWCHNNTDWIKIGTLDSGAVSGGCSAGDAHVNTADANYGTEAAWLSSSQEWRSGCSSGRENARIFEEAMYWHVPEIRLFLNGVEEGNRSYELGSEVEIKYNSTVDNELCIDIDLPGFNESYDCTTTGSGSINISFGTLYYRAFNDGTRSAIINISNSSLLFRADNISIFQNVSMNFTAEAGEIKNFSIDVGADGTIDLRLPGVMGTNQFSVFEDEDFKKSQIIVYSVKGDSSLINYEFPSIANFLYDWFIVISGGTSINNFILNFKSEQYKDSGRTESTWNTSNNGSLQMTSTIQPHRVLDAGGVSPEQPRQYDNLECDDTTVSRDNGDGNQSHLYCAFDNDLSSFTRWNFGDCGDCGAAAEHEIEIGGYNNNTNSELNIKYRLFIELTVGSSGFNREVMSNFSIFDWVVGDWEQINIIRLVCISCGSIHTEDTGVLIESIDLSTSNKYLNGTGQILLKHQERRESGGCGACTEKVR